MKYIKLYEEVNNVQFDDNNLNIVYWTDDEYQKLLKYGFKPTNIKKKYKSPMKLLNFNLIKFHNSPTNIPNAKKTYYRFIHDKKIMYFIYLDTALLYINKLYPHILKSYKYNI